MAPRKGRADPKKDAFNPHSHQSFQSSNEHNPTPDSGNSLNYAPTFIEIYENDDPLPSIEVPYTQNESTNASGPSDQSVPLPGAWNPGPRGYVAPRRRINSSFVRQVRIPHHFSHSAEAYPFLPAPPAPMPLAQPQEQQPQQSNRINNSPAMTQPQQQPQAPRNPGPPAEGFSPIRDRLFSTITPPEYREYERRRPRPISHYDRRPAVEDMFEAIFDCIKDLEEGLEELAVSVYDMRARM